VGRISTPTATPIGDSDQDRCEALEDAPIAGATAHASDKWSLLPGEPDHAEDDDADEWSGVIIYDQNGRWRWA
jgi:hypothetical protein